MKPVLKILAFNPAPETVTEPITKFGGQPVWIDEPIWPFSEEFDRPIAFLGQIELKPEIFGDIEAKMAYLFLDLYNTEEDRWDDQAWGVVLQPGTYDRPARRQATGPTIPEDWQWPEGKAIATPARDYLVTLEEGAEDDIPDDMPWKEQCARYEGVKIGGVPLLLDDYFTPTGGLEPWNLLLQLDSVDQSEIIPFQVQYGDGGCGWFFLSKDGKTVGLCWQIRQDFSSPASS